ncbi:MAG: DUF927 domain-containing protein [Anaerobutyricum hallii]|uniref:DUF927 domain-containing protein n=1 Tax=Anaerobutyricum hallii TaxID=39488 RepID=UPI002A80165C|nr:DUF927 domain-containing protein [Anaerobutyricum hallii]MDY4579772.1 DUF927 domain-containing protein [Anaerobutyricum hallii]
MVPLNQLDAKSIMSREILDEVFGQEDEIYRAELLASLALRASELRCKTEFTTVVNAYKKVLKDMQKKEKEDRKNQAKEMSLVEHFTNFSGSPYDNMACGNWIAADDGICTWNSSTGITDIRACYHPILPVERLKNLQTGEEQLKIAFRRNYKWQEIIVPKDVVATASKIVGLSKRGVAVTSETAKHLVRYLSDVENLNDDYIKIQYSSGKLGWIGEGFLPYSKEIVFDGDARFGQLFESIKEKGRRDIWYEHVKKIRKQGKFEVKFMLAASFASILIKPLNALPFFTDLWGLTGNGKSITHMLAASVWADPAENKYIGNFKSSDVGLEVKADMLNNLPMILDDTSQKDKKIEENFERIVYDLCSGQGKTRSNKELGLSRENVWKLCILTNGEYPLQSYMNQGGAINRILEVECTHEKLFSKPQETVDILKNNFGFAGKDFVEAVEKLGIDNIRTTQQEIMQLIHSDDKTEKQLLSLSIVLTADKIATEMLFQDSQYIDISAAKSTLVDVSDVSPNERCYEYLTDMISMNEQRFDTTTICEKWGDPIERDEVSKCRLVYFYPTALETICKNGGFSKKAFLSWGMKKKLVLSSNKYGNVLRRDSASRSPRKFCCVKLVDNLDEYLKEQKNTLDQQDDGLTFD